MAVGNRADALDILDVRDDLTSAQRKHLNRVVLGHCRVVGVGQPRKSAIQYWARKVREMTVQQLERHVTKVTREVTILVRRLRTVSPGSIFRAALEAEQEVVSAKVRTLNEELLRRKGSNEPARA
jgi:hypothetical protein